MRLSRRALVAASIVGLVLVALLLMAPSLYDVQDRGRDVLLKLEQMLDTAP